MVDKRQMKMAFMMDEGGLRDDGMEKDPMSGNEVPPGSMAKEVRDDVPAQLSEGEYVVPADVVRYYGVKFFEDLRTDAKRGLADMEANGRIGGEPVPAGGPVNEEDLSPEELAVIEEVMSGMAEGGQATNPYLDQQMMYQNPAPQAVGNNVTYMNRGGAIRGYQNSSVVTNAPTPATTDVNVDQAEQDILNAPSQSTFDLGNYSLGFSFTQPSSNVTPLTPEQEDQLKEGSDTLTEEVTLYDSNGNPMVLPIGTPKSVMDNLLAQGYTIGKPQVTNNNESDGRPPKEDEDTNISALQEIKWGDDEAVMNWAEGQADTLLDRGLIGGAMATSSISNIRAAAIIARAKYGEDSDLAARLDNIAQEKEDDLGPIGKALGKIFGMDGTQKAKNYLDNEPTPKPTITSTGSGTKDRDSSPKPKLRPKDDDGPTSPTLGSTPSAASQPTATTGGGMTGSDTRPDDPRGEGQYGGQSTSGSTTYSSSSGSVNTSAKDADMGVGGNPNAGSISSSSTPTGGYVEDADFGLLNKGGLMAKKSKKKK